jgi:hypothetical protein
MASGQACSPAGAVASSAPYTASDGLAALTSGVSISIECR